MTSRTRLPELRKHFTWDDPRWRKAFERLPAGQKLALENSLRDLLTALKTCNHPQRDAPLQRWLPSRWDVPRQLTTRGDWVEYRLGDEENRARAIICFDSRDQVIYLVART